MVASAEYRQFNKGVIMIVKFFILFFINFILTGCVAAVVAGSQVGVEAATEEILPEYQKKGSDLQKMAQWDKSLAKTTYSTSGKEEWSCATILEGKWDDTGAYQYLCLENKDKLSAKETYICKEGKGNIISAVVNKNSLQTVFCKKLVAQK